MHQCVCIIVGKCQHVLACTQEDVQVILIASGDYLRSIEPRCVCVCVFIVVVIIIIFYYYCYYCIAKK